MERKTKIIATLGPASSSPEIIGRLVAAGMDVARLNFSHGTHDEHRRLTDLVRAAADEQGRAVSVLQDIQGPKIRVGSFPGGAAELEVGARVSVRPGRGHAEPGTIEINYPYLLDDIEPGHEIYLADGLIRLVTEKREGGELVARVVTGGRLLDGKGVAFPSSELRAPSITEKDRRDLAFGAELGVDHIAVSFVRGAGDLAEVRSIVGDDVPLIAKIELAAAYRRLDEILAAADGAMVARGDLGVQVPLQKIPLIQLDILRRGNLAGKVTITATEMLESMTQAYRPTRAEVTDVASAVLAGTDAVMLSAETATGQWPVRTVEVMAVICAEVEGSDRHLSLPEVGFLSGEHPFPSATAKAAVEAATALGLDTIVAFTESGNTARLLSKYRPGARIVAFTPNAKILRRMAILWGVQPRHCRPMETTEAMLAEAERRLLRDGLCQPGQGVVMVAGVPLGQRASTNLLKLHVVGG